MTDRHVIRLRGPWQLEPLWRSIGLPDGTVEETTEGLPPPAQLKMPVRWGEILGDEFFGRIRLRRKFGRPTGLQRHETVWLATVCELGVYRVSLNGKTLGDLQPSINPARFDVTERLDERNELVIEVTRLPAEEDQQSPPDGLAGDSWLEIISH